MYKKSVLCASLLIASITILGSQPPHPASHGPFVGFSHSTNNIPGHPFSRTGQSGTHVQRLGRPSQQDTNDVNFLSLAQAIMTLLSNNNNNNNIITPEGPKTT